MMARARDADGAPAVDGRGVSARLGALVRPGARTWQVTFAGLLALVVYGSVVPPSQEPGFVLPIPDWVQHGVAYAALMLTLLAGQRRPRAWIDACALLLLGAAIEAIQGWLGYRSADARDFLADLIGVAMGGAIAIGTFARSSAARAGAG